MVNKYGIDDVIMVPFRIERVTMQRGFKEPKYQLMCDIPSIRTDFPDVVIYANESKIDDIVNRGGDA